MTRRQFIHWGALTAGVGATTGFYTWQVEPFWLEFREVAMPVANLPADMVGRTLMQISDIHVGNRFDYQFLIDSFQRAQQLRPDFVAYTGDYVSYEGPEQLDQLREVLQYAVRGTQGTVGILGNHDYGENFRDAGVGRAISDLLTDSGIHVLRNAAAEFAGLHVIGLDDYWGTNFNPAEAFAAYAPEQAAVVLCHNPDVCDLDVWADYRGWILAGHTHGGQVKPPFLPPPVLPVRNERYTAGRFDLSGDRTLYINRALGHLWQVRFNVRPEITLFHLTAA